MKCSRPFVRGTVEFGCGQCMPCRLNRRRLWTSRLMLEAQKHQHSLFVTLTYDNAHLPEGGVLKPEHMQGFLKRLRERLAPLRLRFYGVGEYGDRTLRPHYHLALFGVRFPEDVRASWTYGNVHVGTLTPESASYIVGYVCKRMTKSDDPRLNGKPPEFARMSLKPGIGAGAMPDFADSILNKETGELYLQDGDVVSSYRWNGKSYPLGRYLRRRLRRLVRMPEAAPVLHGELLSYKRYVDLSAHGLSGWRAREEGWLQSQRKANKKVEISNSRKGIGL